MDIITHTLSGLLFGTVAATFLADSGWKKSRMIIQGGIGGCLPDLDAISLWSGFDSTIGRLFQLSLPGHEIYFSKLWYSHHGFFHSLAAICVYIILFGWIKYLLSPAKTFILFNNFLSLSAFAGGYFIHILEDLPTPSGSWGGVNIFWPSENWVGGTGQIWWWNNYDIFLIVSSAFLLNIVLLILRFKNNFFRYITLGIFLLATALVFHQISVRPLNFNDSGFQSREKESLEIQRNILGETVFNIMTEIDTRVKVNF